jgi:hypothetical protein
MADVEPQTAQGSAAEDAASGADKGHSSRTIPTGGAPGMRSGITWWEACGGWNSRYALSI